LSKVIRWIGAASIAIAAVSVAGCGRAPTTSESWEDLAARPVRSPPDPQRIAGTYRRTEPATGTLALSRSGDAFRVVLAAAGRPDGGGTAADCRIGARGPLIDGSIRAVALPPEPTEDPADAWVVTPSETVTVRLEGREAIVWTRAEACPFGSNPSGRYVRE
jgi:hypothetical protein